MYRTFLKLSDFITACALAEEGRVYVQASQSSQKLQGIIDAVTSTVLVTALTHELREPIILVGRIVVEAAQLWPDSAAASEALNDRSRVAADLVGQALARAGLEVRPGILLVPGLFDDLAKFHTDHDLWSFAGDARDIAARRLVPAPDTLAT